MAHKKIDVLKITAPKIHTRLHTYTMWTCWKIREKRVFTLFLDSFFLSLFVLRVFFVAINPSTLQIFLPVFMSTHTFCCCFKYELNREVRCLSTNLYVFVWCIAFNHGFRIVFFSVNLFYWLAHTQAKKPTYSKN